MNVTHMKNCEPLVSFPRLAIDNRKALSCLRVKFSSVGSRKTGNEVSRAHPLISDIRKYLAKNRKKEKSAF